jgi:hypothetical protein
MKISLKHTHQDGNVFLMVIVSTGILSVACLGSYLSLASTEHRSVMRSQAWNTAMPLAEAGVEEALSHITRNTNNFAADGWTPQGTNTYTKQRTLSTGTYSVSLSGSPGAQVTITSTGHVQFQDTCSLGTSYAVRVADLKRTVQVVAQSASASPQMVGLVAKSGITLKGDLGMDSYNSTNSLYSTQGQYDPAKARDHALVETPLGFGLGGNSHVKGSVATGPGGLFTVWGNTRVGSTAWVDGKNKGIEPGYSTNNFNAAIPDVVAPFTSAAAPSSGTVSNTSYNYVLDGGNYMATSLTDGGSHATLVVTAPSVLLLTGDTSLQSVVFAPGATLDIYIATPSISFCPTIQGMTDSQIVTPTQFRVWGLPTCTSMDMTAGLAFTGLIYAPEADLQARGHAAFYGAITANTFYCNGTFDLHYDEATASFMLGGNSFRIMSWAEL